MISALKSQALAEAQVHAQQDLGPVLALGAAGAGVDAQERVAGIAFAVKVMLDLGFLDVFLEKGHFFFQFGQEFRVLVDQLKIGFQFFDDEAQFPVHLQKTVQDFLFLLQAGRLLGLVPDGGIGQLDVDFLYSFGFFGYFKETPEDRWISLLIRRKVI